ncbi:MAG: hypothetical protein ABEJ42_07210 [Halobacteriaceae archaeon]
MSGDDRGQLFVLTALTLAVLFVALALVLNTAIYTENLGTRSADPGASDALALRSDAIDAGERLVVATNADYDDDATLSGLRTDLEAHVDDYERQRGHHGLAGSHATDVSVASVTGTTRALQDTERPFTDSDHSDGTHASDWTLATGISTVRTFELTVDTSHLATGSGSAPSGAFTVTVTDGTNTWTMDVWDDGGDGDVDLAFSGGTTCDTSGSVTVDVLAGTAGSTCTFTPATDVVSSGFTVSYDDGDAGDGTYTLLVDPGASVAGTDHFDTAPSSTNPFAIDAIWSTTLNLTYRGPDLLVGTDVVVQAGGGS